MKGFLILSLLCLPAFFSRAFNEPRPAFCSNLEVPNKDDYPTPDCPSGAQVCPKSEYEEKLSEYNTKQARCDKWEQDQKTEEQTEIDSLKEITDQKRQELEDAQRKQEEMMEEQKQLVETRKQQCQRSSDDFKRERRSVEQEVVRQEDQRDQIEDQINKAQVEISKLQDGVRDNILQARQRHRQNANRMEDQKEQEVRQAKDQILQLNDEIDKNYQALELLENQRQTLYDQRYAGYTAEYTKCYDQAIEKVEKERQERRQAIESSGGVYQVRTMEEAYLSDPKIIEQYYLNRFRTLTRICFTRKTGSGSLMKREAGVIENSEHPFVMNIENTFKTEWSKLNMQEKAIKDTILKIEKRIQDIAGERSKYLRRYADNVRAINEDFKEVNERSQARLERVRTEKENEILSFRQKLARLHIRQPSAHFLESIELAYKDCCAGGGDQMLCRQLAAYTSDLRRTERARLRVNPVRKSRRGASGGSRGLQ